MIVQYTMFGILLTDEFGEPTSNISDEVLEFVSQYLYTETLGVVHCPSAEEQQYVLGFKTPINKKTDFKVLEQNWIEVMDKAPAEIKEIAYKLKDLGEAVDVHFLAGNC